MLVNIVEKNKVISGKYRSIKKSRNKIVEIYLSRALKVFEL